MTLNTKKVPKLLKHKYNKAISHINGRQNKPINGNNQYTTI